MSQAERYLQRLLDTADRKDSTESDIKSDVKNLFNALTGDAIVRLEVSVDGGAIDVLVRNTIVEAKRRVDRLGNAPAYIRDKRERRAYAATQLQDYINARYQNVSESESVYYGYTTNGSIWHRWEVQVGGEEPLLTWTKDLNQSYLSERSRHGLSRTEVMRGFLQELYRNLDKLPPPPSDFSQLLTDLPARAEEIAFQERHDPEFQTKRALWEDLMRGAFIVKPDDEDESIRLFAHHSLLVEIARRVAHNITHTFQDEDRTSFSSWLRKFGGGQVDTRLRVQL